MNHAELWLVTTGHAMRNHSVHSSLDAALRCVHQRILRGKGFDSINWQAQTGDDRGVGDGTLTLLSWDAPSKRISLAEIKQKRIDKEIDSRIADQWAENPPQVTDWDRTKGFIEFIGNPVDSVSICRVDRHFQYLLRAAQANGRDARIGNLKRLIEKHERHLADVLTLERIS